MLNPLHSPLLRILHQKIKPSSKETREALTQIEEISRSVRDRCGKEDRVSLKGLPACISYVNIHRLITIPALGFKNIYTSDLYLSFKEIRVVLIYDN